MGEQEAFSRDELEQLEIFRSVDLLPIEPVLHSCTVRRLAPGEVLIAAGKPNHYLYLLLSGRLGIHVESVESDAIATVLPGESVGEISIIDRQAASAYVVAELPTRVLAVDEEILWMLVNTSHAVSSNLLALLARRLRYGNVLIHQGREQLREYQFQATIDPITSLYNRNWLNRMLPRQMDRARHGEEALALLMVDIDHFKVFNDTHGHLAGDRALAVVAARLRDNLRPVDMAARFGGEEFAVMLPRSDRQGGVTVAERLRRAVRSSPIPYPPRDNLPPVTLSIGVAEMDSDFTPDAFIAAADSALYRAKQAGRDRLSE